MKTMTFLLALGLCTPSLFAQDTIVPGPDMSDVNIEEQKEGSWIAIDGTIRTLGERSFILGYDGGTVAVAYGGENLRQHQFSQGQEVTVYGWIDNELFNNKVIKAKAIAFAGEDGARTLVSEEDMRAIAGRSRGKGTVVHGVVTGIDGRTVTVDQEEGEIMIDTRGMAYDPTTAKGNNRVEVGDIVTAHGNITNDFWSVRTLRAKALDVVSNPQSRAKSPATQPMEQEVAPEE